MQIRVFVKVSHSLLALLSQLSRERFGADSTGRCAAAREDLTALGPVTGGDARDGQLQLRDTR